MNSLYNLILQCRLRISDERSLSKSLYNTIIIPSLTLVNQEDYNIVFSNATQTSTHSCSTNTYYSNHL